MTFERDDRGVSVAVTHVLTVGITAILISGLLIGASSLLETQQEQSAQKALETIGERLATEITSVDRAASSGTSTSVQVNTSHQRSVAGSQYDVSLQDDCSGYPLIEENPCVILESRGEDVTVAVPLSEDIDVKETGPVTGGPISIENEGSEIKVTTAS